MEFTEKTIQFQLYKYFNQKYFFTNTRFFITGEEAGILMFSHSGYITEIEIKLSKSDFKADFKKPKHKFIELNDNTKYANRFYYAVPKDLIQLNEIPKYAGLIYINKYGDVEIIKKAPLLHKYKFSEHRLFNKMYYNYISNLVDKFSQIHTKKRGMT